ncbi:MAG: GIY-YIG nuclease family protein [Candidatus Odinarchaeia archaeon]
MHGIYYIVIYLNKKTEVEIGKLGKILFEKGIYVYVGSGKGDFGGGELINRVLRHLRPSKKTRWHIDYLLNSKSTQIKFICIIESDNLLECDLINKIKSSFDCEFIPNFGSSDCYNRCESHFVRLLNLAI